MASTVGVNYLLFENDLYGRMKQVKLGDDELPDQQQAKRGVQQGSVLSPMFLFCFVLFFYLFIFIIIITIFIIFYKCLEYVFFLCLRRLGGLQKDGAMPPSPADSSYQKWEYTSTPNTQRN